MQKESIDQQSDNPICCSVGIMAHNEEANIGHTIRAVLAQQGQSLHIAEIIVVASGCTDRTVAVVNDIASQEPCLRLFIQKKREGKASAINLFLQHAISQIVVLIGADVIPEAGALERLCSPLTASKVGMVGGRPIPVNDPATFMGHAVHLQWRLHDRLARIQPKLGEVIAFKNVIAGIPPASSVDEISIQALLSQLGYHTLYEPSSIVYNKGPLTVQDFLKQRRRIYAGHLQVRDQQKYAASTMNVFPIFHQLLLLQSFALQNPVQVLWTLGTILLEFYARIQGYYDYLCKREHYIWQMAESTKDPGTDTQRLQHNNTLNVIIFRLIPDGIENDELHTEGEDRNTAEITRKLLPLLRARLRKESNLSLSISGPGILTAVIRAEQQQAERIAQNVQEIIHTTPVRMGMRGREVKVTATCSSLTFALNRARDQQLMVNNSLLQKTVLATQIGGE